MAQFGLSLFNDFGYLVQLEGEGAERQPLPPWQGLKGFIYYNGRYLDYIVIVTAWNVFVNKLDYN